MRNNCKDPYGITRVESARKQLRLFTRGEVLACLLMRYRIAADALPYPPAKIWCLVLPCHQSPGNIADQLAASGNRSRRVPMKH